MSTPYTRTTASLAYGLVFVGWALATAPAAATSGTDARGPGGETTVRQTLTQAERWSLIRTIWQTNRASMESGVSRSAQTHDTNGGTYSLYNLQVILNNLVVAAFTEKKHDLLSELSTILLIPLGSLEEQSTYIYSYLPGQPKTAALPLQPSARFWTAKDGSEDILSSSQFTYLIASLIHRISALPPSVRTDSMKELVARYVPVVVRDHYSRWLFAEPGMFQVKGWGCSAGAFNHRAFLSAKLCRTLGAQLSYCNAVLDSDMWIIAGVTEMLAANAKDPASVPLANEDKRRFLEYVALGTSLLKQRLTPTRLTDFQGMPSNGYGFDLGAWDDHAGNNDFSGYTGDAFPVETQKKRTRNIGWDISHARRFVHVFNSLYENRNTTKQDFPDTDTMRGLTNEFLYRAFNRNFSRPLFTNYIDGTNGWYRVAYDRRSGFGYPPSSLSAEVVPGGWGLWSRFNPDMTRVMDAVWKMIRSPDPEVAAFRERYYELGPYNQLARKKTSSLDTEKGWNVLNFLASYPAE